MKAPDKIYVVPMKTSENQDAFVGLAYELDKLPIDKTEYIRKDALMEWAITNRDKLDALSDNDAVRWGQRNAFQQMIDKLNSL